MKTLRVLVLVDGSAASESVLPVVGRLVAPAVTLLRVLDAGSFHRVSLEADEDVRRSLARVKATLLAQGASEVETRIRYGGGADAILEEADHVAPSLVALATHGEGGLDHRPFGRTAARVIHGSRFPVLAIRPDGATTASRNGPSRRLFDHVLTPSDGSPLAWRAIEALGLLGAAGKARLTIFGVVEDLARPTLDAAHHAPAESVGAPVENDLRRRCDVLREKLQRDVSRARDGGFEASDEVEVGRPADAILGRAESATATLIALATHGRTGVARFVLGSLTEQILSATPVPVLVCR